MRNKVEKLIAVLKAQERVAPDEEKHELWEEIIKTARHKRKIVLYRKAIQIGVASSAAIILCLLYIHFGQSPAEEKTFTEKAILSAMEIQPGTDEVLLIAANSDSLIIKEKEEIIYSETGQLSINKNQIKNETTEKDNTLNQLIVPYGKRTQLLLSDGTRLWVNAGSRVLYPSRFAKEKREIFIDGEVYLEVHPIKNHPFIIKTITNFEVEVTGTKFNICTYNNLEKASVVLAEGGVRIHDSFNRKLDLTPNQMVEITEKGIGKPISVNAEDYTGWIEGALTLHSHNLADLLKRLEIYYGVEIEKNPQLKDIHISGKFFLHDKFEDVLEGLERFIRIKYSSPAPGRYTIRTEQ